MAVVTHGRIGFLLGEEVFEAGPGELVRKPRDQWHTFWNAGAARTGPAGSTAPDTQKRHPARRNVARGANALAQRDAA
ncbi:quercetin dioxygenase-like cupin family protein [Arthrobacter sp. B3I9]|nr:quercetin dioxygenase-like cupin family protein [Arthrobacter sp. B3I9]